MSLYEIGQRVGINGLNTTGYVTERNYIGRPRRAAYLVEYAHGHDVLLGSDNLRAADGCCDDCGRYLPHSSFNAGGRGPEGLRFCFLCTRGAW